MALRHAVLAALLGNELSGYQLAKLFDVNISNYWHALPQQLYTELTKLEAHGLITGREVVQRGRPNKRVYTLTDAGTAELSTFIAGPSKPSAIRDDLMVKMQAAEAGDTDRLIEQLEDRAAEARGKIDQFERQLHRARGDLDEETFLAQSPWVGPYLVGLRGRSFEQEALDWCTHSANILRARTAARPRTDLS